MNNLLDSTASAISLSQELSRAMASAPQSGSLSPVADPFKTQSQYLLGLEVPLRFRHGVVVDYVPHVGMYRVQPDSGGALTLCLRTGMLGTSPLGVADNSTLMPGDRVLFAQNMRSLYGEILTVLPGLVTDARTVRPDFIVQGSNVGLLADAAHRAPFLMGRANTNGGLANYGSRSPIDGLAGELNFMTETGLLLFLDSAMASMRVDELCGLWMFYCDQMLRLAGYNMQQWTCAYETETFDDEGELQHYHGQAIYPWEQMGQVGKAQKISTVNSAQVTQQEKPWLAALEPVQQDLKPFHRIQTYGGYLGQGIKQLVSGQPNQNVNAYSYQPEQTGLSEVQQLLTGQLLWRTAKGVVIAKRPAIPVPQRIKLAADPAGDSAKDYSASGLDGKHKVTDGPAAPQKHPSLSKLAALTDLHAYLFNWAGEAGLHYHKKDFRVPDEAEAQPHTNQVVPEFQKFKDKPYLDPPEPVEIDVDHRQKVKIYPNSADITLTEEGGIVLRDGYGSEVSLSNGKIKLSAPLDIEISCGRTLTLWGGRDVVLRAKHSIDLTATENDIRVAAGHNVQIIGAVAGEDYGVLIESRSTKDTYSYDKPGHETRHSGIVLRSAEAPIVSYSKNMYLRSDQNIVFDAADGSGTIVSLCSREEHYLSDSCTQYFGTQGNISQVNVFQQGVNIINGALHVDGQLTNRGNHILQGNVLVTQGHIFTQNGSDKVSRLSGSNLSNSEEAVRSNSDLVSTYRDNGENAYKANLDEAWFSEEKAGNPTIRGRASGSLRTVEDYGTSEYVIFEPRWGQLARLGGQTLGDWNESPVTFNGEDTYCYPGTDNFKNETYYAIDLTLFDTATGVSQTRGEKYEDPRLKDPRAGSLHAFPTIQ